jgi:hypothetical protein
MPEGSARRFDGLKVEMLAQFDKQVIVATFQQAGKKALGEEFGQNRPVKRYEGEENLG